MADDSPIDAAKLMRTFFALWDQGTAKPAPEDGPAERLMARALAVANMPSRGEISDIAARLDRIEATLVRIEHALTEGARPKKRGKAKD